MTDEQRDRSVIRCLPDGDQPPQDRARTEERGVADHHVTMQLRQLRTTTATGALVLVDRRQIRTLGERERHREAIRTAYRQTTS